MQIFERSRGGLSLLPRSMGGEGYPIGVEKLFREQKCSSCTKLARVCSNHVRNFRPNTLNFRKVKGWVITFGEVNGWGGVPRRGRKPFRGSFLSETCTNFPDLPKTCNEIHVFVGNFYEIFRFATRPRT